MPPTSLFFAVPGREQNTRLTCPIPGHDIWLGCIRLSVSHNSPDLENMGKVYLGGWGGGMEHVLIVCESGSKPMNSCKPNDRLNTGGASVAGPGCLCARRGKVCEVVSCKLSFKSREASYLGFTTIDRFQL